jgi:hypothetical protein
MNKDALIIRITKMVYGTAFDKGLDVENKGLGHQYDNTVWKGFKDNSGIPTIVAKKDDYSIKFDPIWDSMQICIRRKGNNGKDEMLIVQFSDTEIKGDNIIHTGDFQVSEVRVAAHNYRKCIDEVYEMIDMLMKDE